MIDSLDTMWIMDLHDEFYDTLPLVANMSFATSKVFLPAYSVTKLTYLL